MQYFLPEGNLIETPKNKLYTKNLANLQENIISQRILEGRASVCDSNHNLIIDFGFIKGIIPKNDCAIGIKEGLVKDISIISKVNKPVCFKVVSLDKDSSNNPIAILSRKVAQQQCMDEYISKLTPGDVIDAKVTHLEQFGCFVDIGCGIPSLIPIDLISISRISHPKDRFKVGQDIKVIVKGIQPDGKICLSHKELLGSWEENSANFKPGETVAGIVRSIENYGIFVELTPNLAGLAEIKEDVEVGQQASVYIKNIIPEKMKVKLIIVNSFDEPYVNYNSKYYIQKNHIDKFIYSPESSSKKIETIF